MISIKMGRLYRLKKEDNGLNGIFPPYLYTLQDTLCYGGTGKIKVIAINVRTDNTAVEAYPEQITAHYDIVDE